MKNFIKVLSVIIVSALISFYALSGEKKIQTENDIVCCKIFGYGAKMKKCCIKYRWIPRKKCRVPDNFTGGGRKIVKDSFCRK